MTGYFGHFCQNCLKNRTYIIAAYAQNVIYNECIETWDSTLPFPLHSTVVLYGS